MQTGCQNLVLVFWNLSGIGFCCPGVPLLAGINFNPNMDKYSHVQYSVEWHNLSIPKLYLGMDN